MTFEIRKLNRLKSFVHQTVIVDGKRIEVGAVFVGKPKDCDSYITQRQGVAQQAA